MMPRRNFSVIKVHFRLDRYIRKQNVGTLNAIV